MRQTLKTSIQEPRGISVLLILLIYLFSTQALGQDDKLPILEFTGPEEPTIPGVGITVRLTVLVPTFLSTPIPFPSLDSPNLRVILPNRATGPVSRRIGSTTWSGVSRRYLIVPLTDGRYSIPSQTIAVRYADPDHGETVTANLEMPEFSVTAMIPAGAEQLNPFIAAESLTLSQEIEGDTAEIVPGDSIRWHVNAEIVGNSPMVIPQLIPEFNVDGLSTYESSPEVSEQQQGNQVQGTRAETLTFVAQAATQQSIPSVGIRWYNLNTQEIDFSSIEGFDISVTRGAVSTPLRGVRASVTDVLFPLAIAIAIVLLFYVFHGSITQRIVILRENILTSEPWAFRQLLRAIRTRNLPSTMNALSRWESRWSGPNPRADATIHLTLLRLGRNRYSAQAGSTGITDWNGLKRRLIKFRHQNRPHRHFSSARSELGPLNPQ